MHWHLWVTLTGNDYPSSASSGPVFTVGNSGTPHLSAVCNLHYTLMTVHLAILALGIGSMADTTNAPDVFVDEGVEGFTVIGCHLPSLHHHVAVVIVATCLLRVHMLSQETLVHAVLAIAGLYQP